MGIGMDLSKYVNMMCMVHIKKNFIRNVFGMRKRSGNENMYKTKVILIEIGETFSQKKKQQQNSVATTTTMA